MDNKKYRSPINTQRTPLQDVLPLRTPYSVYIDVCSSCNFRCKFCAAQSADGRKGHKAEAMGLPLFRKIIDDMKKFDEKVKIVRLQGDGEPLLNKNFAEMARYARNAQVANWIEVTTNGSMLSPQLNRELVRGGVIGSVSPLKALMRKLIMRFQVLRSIGNRLSEI